MRIPPFFAVALLGLTAAAVTLPSPAEAWPRREKERLDRGYVTAESRYGGGTITAPVRSGPSGPQVRLPGGTWIDCEQTCSDTLRRETVDFWKSREWPYGKDSPGYFTFRF